jgi:hypothetical protein
MFTLKEHRTDSQLCATSKEMAVFILIFMTSQVFWLPADRPGSLVWEEIGRLEEGRRLVPARSSRAWNIFSYVTASSSFVIICNFTSASYFNFTH